MAPTDIQYSPALNMQGQIAGATPLSQLFMDIQNESGSEWQWRWRKIIMKINMMMEMMMEMKMEMNCGYYSLTSKMGEYIPYKGLIHFFSEGDKRNNNLWVISQNIY